MESFDEYIRRRRPPPSEAWQRYLPLFPWIVGLMLALWFLSDLTYTVKPYEQAVVLRFGKYHGTTMPGLHLKVPLADQVMKVSVEEHGLRLPFGRPSRTEDPINLRQIGLEDETLMLTGDLNTASVEWTVQWKVTDPARFLFRFPLDEDNRFAEGLLTTVARTVMNRLVGNYSFDEVIGPKRSDIAFEARRDAQRILDAYTCGITVTALQMQRVIPPDRVKPAFDHVNAVIQQKQKLENDAEATRNKLIPEARANRDKMVREAEGYSSRRRAEANGEIEALLAKYHAYQRAPEVTRQRLYLEAMQEVFQGVKDKTILDADLKQLLPLLNLDSKGESSR
ncbi:MAG TPA: FtsH protease activity modulator HflK [Isosphaeraceae bacterium]|nr:FtsH protease activity modulator HflK [Isosphaeraceae bacterium]